MRLTRRDVTRLLGASAVASLLAACQGASAPVPTDPATPSNRAAAPAGAAAAPTAANPLIKPRAAAGADLTAVNANSELAIGRNRFALGLIDSRSQPVTEGSVLVEYFKLTGSGQAVKVADAPAVFRSVGGASKGVWVAPGTFQDPGSWGAQVTLDPSGATPRQARMNFEVRPKFSAPGYDEPAVRSASPTSRDVGGDTSKICSNSPPCALHQLGIADALAPGQKPLVLLFATPALCTSATCAPELEAIEQLQASYAERANFIHVEIYDAPFEQMHVARTVDEWHLPSDPWTFIVDRGGVVRDRFEGAAPMDELEPSLRQLLS